MLVLCFFVRSFPIMGLLLGICCHPTCPYSVSPWLYQDGVWKAVWVDDQLPFHQQDVSGDMLLSLFGSLFYLVFVGATVFMIHWEGLLFQIDV